MKDIILRRRKKFIPLKIQLDNITNDFLDNIAMYTPQNKIQYEIRKWLLV